MVSRGCGKGAFAYKQTHKFSIRPAGTSLRGPPCGRETNNSISWGCGIYGEQYDTKAAMAVGSGGPRVEGLGFRV